ncbi:MULTISPECIES: EcsC family protein [Burkholderia]|uniref:Peptidase n=1 Tax=Burkholderia lata (strain ATCC 17760 / DSM 23089 / LMG 22485 / NCIMB 9086 / R18194 / 383) TaxID=482957 RepID=A0A6P2KFB9_BURL3|nr:MULTISPECIES: EcsC family protein [Burkholderia]MBN3771307.1 EcsC family protein [Burkholderia sp. Se-20378]MBN3796750.1 EcsC family protein [Burkholderia sp. Ac-20392]VWB55261.1 peptidase [Burkholderia lata]VWB76188.1 peptidase [Burkholderia lata]VWM16977.1 peptidase [Burkholderia lata]
MEPISITPAPTLSPEDRDALWRAKQVLESPSLTMKLTGMLGAPVEKMIARLPDFATGKINDATQLALRKCLNIALRTLGKPPAPDAEPDKPSNLLHKLAVATTGAAGGAFGFLALPVELPVTTTLIFRSVCDIARSEGEDLSSVDTQLQCLAVLGMGGNPDKQEEDADLGYFVLRGALAQAISKASSDITTKGIAAHSSAAVFKLVQTVASRFSVQVTEQMAAKSIPAIGAVLGATVNTLFIDHFQQMAHGHFTVRRLERKYGSVAVKAAYQAIDASPAR